LNKIYCQIFFYFFSVRFQAGGPARIVLKSCQEKNLKIVLDIIINRIMLDYVARLLVLTQRKNWN